MKTAARVPKEFRGIGYEVHTGIGMTGVVGVLKNGPSPVVMVRGDMDGLPVREATGLDYASTLTAAAEGGGFTPVAHACGHDAHVTFLVGVAKVMAELKAEWSGTLVLIEQPAEGLILGARTMVQDGLYSKVPQPDCLVSSHMFPSHAAGTMAVRAGRRLAGIDQIDVTIFGAGGHGSVPEHGKDPVVKGRWQSSATRPSSAGPSLPSPRSPPGRRRTQRWCRSCWQRSKATVAPGTSPE